MKDEYYSCIGGLAFERDECKKQYMINQYNITMKEEIKRLDSEKLNSILSPENVKYFLQKFDNADDIRKEFPEFYDKPNNRMMFDAIYTISIGEHLKYFIYS
jgi:hypothetical protein